VSAVGVIAPAALRSMLVRTLKRADRAAALARGRRRALIEVRSPMNLAVLQPIWTALVRDPRVDVAFTSEEPEWVRPFLAAEGLADRLIPQRTASWRRFDLAINADPWNARALRRCWKRANFFHGVAGKYDLDDPLAIGRNIDFAIYDRMMFPNVDRLRRYVDSGVVPAERAALVGLPKIDDLVNGRWSRAEVCAELGLDPALDTILYAPTYSPAASLHLAGEAIIETVLSTGRNVIVKLHERSTVPHPKYTGDVDWMARLARFIGRPRYAFASGAHAGPYLAASNLMITDHSTIGFEFALLDRPLIVYHAPDLLETARINPGKWRQLRGLADVVRSPQELPAAIERALAEPERHAAERRAAAQALFAHAGHATDRALDVVYDLLELTPVRQARRVREVREVRAVPPTQTERAS
jgi:hypothetical protein